MADDPTIQSYNQIAGRYREEWQDRSVMAADVRRFAGMLPAGARVLDIGCGPAVDLPGLRAVGLRVAGVDLSLGMLREGRAAAPGVLVQADMRRLPVRSGCVDGLWVNAALLHLPRDQAPAALHAFRRVLRPGGLLYLSVKMGAGEAWIETAYGTRVPRFFTFWQPEALDGLLLEAGFDIEVREQSQPFGETVWLSRFARNS